MLLPRAYLEAIDRRRTPDREDVVVLAAWAVAVLVLLALFDVVPAAAAGLTLAMVTVAGAIGILLYLQRPAAKTSGITPRLLISLASYHVLVLVVVIGGTVARFGEKPAGLGILAGIIDAAPAAGFAILLWRRAAARRAADGWA